MSANNLSWIQTRPVAASVVYEASTPISVRTEGWTTRRIVAIASAVPAVTMPITGQPMSAANAKAPTAPAAYDVVSRNATPAARDPRSPRRLSNRPSQAKAIAAGTAMIPSTTSGSAFEPASRPMNAPHAATRNAPPR